MKVFLTLVLLIVGTVRADAQNVLSQIIQDCSNIVCAHNQVCFNGTCRDDCRTVANTCREGTFCNKNNGVCVVGCNTNDDCGVGFICKGDDGCVALCDGNTTIGGEVCGGPTPECYESSDAKSAFCGCRYGTCAAGNVCEGTTCEECPKGVLDVDGQSCGCRAGYAADGKGSCAICGIGQDCNCPENTVTNGKGACVACNTANDCGTKGKKCEKAGTFDAKCVNLTCDVGTYMVANDCLSCEVNVKGCAECDKNGVCLKCDASRGLYMDGKTCKSCEVKFGTGCGVCDKESQKCEQCMVGYMMQADGSCKKIICKEDEFLQGELCIKCNTALSFCTKCQNNKTCTQCNDDRTVLENGRCVCKKGWRLNPQTTICERIKCWDGAFHNGKECQLCSDAIQGCDICDDENACLICDAKAGYVNLLDGQCRKVNCPMGYYRQNTACNLCSEAVANCMMCSEIGDKCLQCEEGFVSSPDYKGCNPIICPADGYLKGNDCAKCDMTYPHCAKCNKSECLECEKFYEKKDGKCVPKKCTGNDYLNQETGNCEPCGIGFITADTFCMPKSCPEGQYLQGDDCLTCPENCRRCENGDSCRVCKGSFGLQGSNKMCQKCDVGYYLEGTYCRPCEAKIPNCIECTSDGSTCLDCGKARMTLLRKCEN